MKLSETLFKIIFCVIFIVFSFVVGVISQPAFAEYSVEDRPNFSVSTHGNNDKQTMTLSATYPLDFINGYAGVEWIHFRDEAPDHHDYIRARIEGGYHRGMFGLRLYSRYGKKTLSEQESLFHGGMFFHVDIINQPTIKLNGGVGTWLAQEELHADFNVNTDMEWGPQAHIELQFPYISVLTEFLPTHRFNNFQVRVLPILILPISKISIINLVALEISGEIQYDNITHHVDIEPWNWHWKNALNFSF